MNLSRLRDWLLKALLLALPIAYVPWADDPFRAFREEIFQVGGAAAVLLWLYSRTARRDDARLSPRGVKTGFLLFACGAAALFISLLVNGGSVSAVINVALGGVLFLALYNALTPENAFGWTKLFIFAAVANGVLGIAQFFGFDPFFKSLDPAFHNVYRRYLVAGFMDSPNMLAPFVASFAPLAFAFFMHESAKGKIIAWTLRLVFLLLVVGLTQNLGAIAPLGAVLGAMLVLFTLRRPSGEKPFARKLAAAWGIALVAVAVAGVSFARQDDTTRILKRYSMDERRMQNEACLMMFKGAPLAGKGPGFFYAHFEEYRRAVWFDTPPLRLPDRPAHQAHNDYLQLLAEGGLLAAIPFGCLLLLAFYRHGTALLGPDAALSYPNAPLLAGAIGGFWVIALNALVNFPFHIAPLAMTAIFWGAIAAALIRRPHNANNVTL